MVDLHKEYAKFPVI